MKRYAQFYMKDESRRINIPILGNDGVRILDGRLSTSNLVWEGISLMNKMLKSPEIYPKASGFVIYQANKYLDPNKRRLLHWFDNKLEYEEI